MYIDRLSRLIHCYVPKRFVDACYKDLPRHFICLLPYLVNFKITTVVNLSGIFTLHYITLQ